MVKVVSRPATKMAAIPAPIPPWKVRLKAKHMALLTATHAHFVSSAISSTAAEPDADKERQQLAVAITNSQFSLPDHDISDTWTAVGEPGNTVNYLNTINAQWVSENSQYWAWVHCTASDVSSTKTMQQFAAMCYQHLAPRYNGLSS